AYAIFGSAGGFGTPIGGYQVIDVSSLAASQGFVIRGTAHYDDVGSSVSSAGDVNGDGYDDLLVGAPKVSLADGGAAYVIFGGAGGFGTLVGGRQVIDLATLGSSQGFVIQGDAVGDQAGCWVSTAGDVNGDGFDDMIVGARYGDDGAANAGEAYVVFGSQNGFGTSVGGRQVVDLTSLQAAQGFIIQGSTSAGQVGYQV